jgi:flavin-dependent dehydrogenase
MQELRAAVVIAADGASSVLATKIRHKHYPPACHAIGLRGYVTTQAELDYTTHMHFIRDALPGYAWMFPVAPDCANVGVWTTARQHRRSRRALQAILDTFLATPAVVSRLGNSYTMHDFQGWKLTLGGSENDARAFPGALLVGDAGAFVNPATGAGIAAALMTGRMAAEVIVEALDEETGPARDRVLRTFDQRWRNELSMRLRRGYMVQQLVLSWPEPLSLFNHWAGEYPGLGQTLLGMLDQFT